MTRWFDDALRFAVDCHEGQHRKGTDTPYIVHPMRVALTLLRYQFERPVVVAALLHDVVEDSDVDFSTLARRFGGTVAALVESVTERDRTLPWRERKTAALDQLARASRDEAGLKASDVLDNLRSMLTDYSRVGELLWRRFNAAPADQLWYFNGVAEGVADRMGNHALAAELANSVAELGRIVRYAE